MRVLQGHVHVGRLLQLLAHNLEEVQRCHLNGAKQEGLLGSSVLDVRPARFLETGARREHGARACVHPSLTQRPDALCPTPAAHPDDDITARAVEAHLQACELIVVLQDLVVLLLHVARQLRLGALDLLLALLRRPHEVVVHGHQGLVARDHLVDLFELQSGSQVTAPLPWGPDTASLPPNLRHKPLGLQGGPGPKSRGRGREDVGVLLLAPPGIVCTVHLDLGFSVLTAC